MRLAVSIEVPNRMTTKQRVVGILLIFICIIATVTFWSFLSQANAHRSTAALTINSDEVVDTFEKRLEVYGDILYGIRGLFLVDDEVDRSEWDTYTHSQQIFERYPGITSLLFAEVVTPEEVADLEARLNSVRSFGEPPATVFPSNQNARMAVVSFSTPDSSRGRTGYDILTHQTIAPVLNEADVSGTPVATKAFQPITSPNDPNARVTVALAVYDETFKDTMTDEQKKLSVKGYLLASMRPDEIFETGLSFMEEKQVVHMTVSDHDGDVVYAHGEKVQPPTLTREVAMDVGGKPWKFVFTAPLEYSLTFRERVAPIVMVGGGILFMILLTSLYFFRRGIRIKFSRAKGKV